MDGIVADPRMNCKGQGLMAPHVPDRKHCDTFRAEGPEAKANPGTVSGVVAQFAGFAIKLGCHGRESGQPQHCEIHGFSLARE